MKKRNGFTLIELLGVLVILGIVLVIAVPSMTKTLKKSKDDEYKRLVKTIEIAAENYIEKNRDQYSVLNEVGGVVTITLQQLIDDSLLQNPVLNPKTGKDISGNATVIAQTDSDKTLNFRFTLNSASLSNYVKNGLILHYDGIENNGFGKHNHKATLWKDLSGRNNDAQLNNVMFDQNSGWNANSLHLDDEKGNKDFSVLQTTTFSGMKSFTIEVTGSFNVYSSGNRSPRIISSNGSYLGNYQSINGVDITQVNQDKNYKSYVSNGDSALAKEYNIASYSPQMTLTIRFDDGSKQLTYFANGRKVKEDLITNFTTINLSKIGLAYEANGAYVYHSVRVYNGVLTNEEIKQNYEVDQTRFGN